MEKFRDFQLSGGGNNCTMNYRVGLCTYGEGLMDGQLRSFGWNGAGYNVRNGMMADNGCIHDSENLQAFVLELDGQSLMSHWELINTEKTEEDGIMTVKVHLRHGKRPAEVAVCTKFDGSGCLSRWLEITNKDTKSVTLGRLAPMSGVLESSRDWRKFMQDPVHNNLYRLGYFENTEHMHEGQFKWHTLHTDAYSFGGRYSRMRYRHPFFVLENRAKGTCFAAQLAYSGGYKFTFDLRPDPSNANLVFAAEVDGNKPLRVIAPGETVVSPELLISMVNGDMDMAINQTHEHIRSAVMKKPHGVGCYTETAGPGEMPGAKASIDRAASRGFDIFYIDAGWYFPKGQDCLGWTGRWDPDPERFPNGLKEMVDYCHEKGIMCGFWMEPERVGSHCPIWEQEMDKTMVNYTDKHPCQYPEAGKGGVYDLSRKEVCDYIEEQIDKLITESGLDMFRLDFNTDYAAPRCYNMVDGYMESADFRYNENFTAMFDRLRKKHPKVIFENCASGGGRTDLGTVKYFDHTWVTDNPVAPRCFAITNGMSMCLPPELIDRLVTTMDAPRYGSLDFDIFQLMFVRPTSHFPGESPENPLQISHFKRFMKLYNEFARPMLPHCRIYHHTPSFEDCEPKGVGILEEVAEDSSRAMLGVFALADPCADEQKVCFKGIDASKKYRVTAVEADETFEVSGYELKYKGITAILHGALTAELFLAQAID